MNDVNSVFRWQALSCVGSDALPMGWAMKVRYPQNSRFHGQSCMCAGPPVAPARAACRPCVLLCDIIARVNRPALYSIRLYLGRVRCRQTPHIYTDKELADLVAAAAGLEGDNGMRGLVFSTLFGLIAATGMRISEALNLADVDVDLGSAQPDSAPDEVQ